MELRVAGPFKRDYRHGFSGEELIKKNLMGGWDACTHISSQVGVS